MRRRAALTGTRTAEAIDRVLSSRIFPRQAYNSCQGVFSLAAKYGEKRLEAACGHILSHTASLTGMISLPPQQRPAMELAVAKLVDAERMHRKNRKTEMYLKTSRLRYNAVMEDIICSSERNLTKDRLAEIADCSFIPRAENILVTGLTGVGKSYLACALGRQACTLGYKTEYLNMNRFVEKIALAKIDGTFLKVISRIERLDLIILDDWGLQPLDQNARLALLQLLEERYERKSMIIASQLPVKKWYDYIGEPTLADAIMDRLVSKAFIMDLKGESLRMQNHKK